MRRFTDSAGITWDVVIGRESWGALLALFVTVRNGTAEVRQVPLRADSQDAAMQELAGLDDAGLQALLDRSSLKGE
ncbi:hypothetical protein BH23GEM10_BH23GEM10_09830 [soil metagenome]